MCASCRAVEGENAVVKPLLIHPLARRSRLDLIVGFMLMLGSILLMQAVPNVCDVNCLIVDKKITVIRRRVLANYQN